MALFGNSGRQGQGLQALLDTVKNRGYAGENELNSLLKKIFNHPDARPRKLLFLLSSPNPSVREKSMVLFTKLSGDGAAEAILEAMLNAPEAARKALSQELIKLDRNQLGRTLGSLASAKDPAHRALALEIIESHPQPNLFLSLIKRALDDDVSAVRCAATSILARGAKHPSVRLQLIQLLNSEDEKVLYEALRGLSRYPGPDLVEPFFALMPRVDRGVRDKLIKTLSTLAENPSAQLEEFVLPVLGDENQELRDAASKLLASMPSRKRVLRAFFIHSKGLATWLRARTTASILKIADNLTEPLSELLDDPDPDVRVAAMVMVGEAKTDCFVPLVEKIFASDADWWIRSLAVDVLAKHPSPRILDQLLIELDNPDLRYSIISALGKIPDPQTLRPLFSCLNDPSRGIRVATLQALGQKPAADVAARMLAIAQEDPELKVRETAKSVLGEMKDVDPSDLESLQSTTDEEEDDEGIGTLKMVNPELNEPPRG